MRNKKIISILFISLLLIAITVFIINSKFNNYETSIASQQDDSIIEDNKCLSISEIKKNIDSDKIFYIYGEGMFIYEPTIENLYENADLVMIGKFNKNVETYVPGVSIHTKIQFDTVKILKNTSDVNVDDNVIVDTLGGAVTLSEYMNNNHTVKDGEFENVSPKERSNYYVIQEYAPEDKLDFSSNNNNEYLLFLGLRDGQFYASASYYGIRKINNNTIFDYDTNKYVTSNLVEK